MAKLILIILVLIATFAAVFALNSRSQWDQFKTKYSKQYSSPIEDARRFEIFAKNKLEVDRFNAKQSRRAGYFQSLNQFSDLTQSELAGNKPEVSLPESNEDTDLVRKLLADYKNEPAAVDWRKEGRVSLVKDQSFCDASVVFATVGLLEGQQKNVKNISRPIDLSAQQLVDCSGYLDCAGGELLQAIKFVVKEEGLMSEVDYPYAARDGPRCEFNESKVVIQPKNYTVLSKDDEKVLKTFVGNYGPVAVSVNAITPSFRHYKGGIYSDQKCGWGVTSSLLVVGYDTDPVGGPYWILKNSWGKDWGEEGYMRLKMGINMCLVASAPIIVTF